MAQDNTPRWHILTYINPGVRRTNARKTIDWYNDVEKAALTLFAPDYVVREERDGKPVVRSISLTFHYVFVKGTFAEVKRLCGLQRGFAFLLDKAGSERYATLTDAQMDQFRLVASVYENNVPFYPSGSVDLEEGDLVEVVGGPFAGLRGRYLPRARSKSGNVVLQLSQGLATAAFDISATDIRILEFAATNRPYEQIDRFTPRLLTALRHYSRREPLPKPLAAQLTVFSRRMGEARTGNRKLEAKLAAHLAAASLLLGDPDGARRHAARFEALREALSNPWTESLADLLLSVVDRTPERLVAARHRLTGLTATTAPQRQLLEELSCHIGQ